MIRPAPDAVLPYNNVNNLNPSSLSEGAPAYGEPTSFVSGVGAAYRAAVAAGAMHYKSRMLDEYGVLQDKLAAAGGRRTPLFAFNEDQVTDPEFQALMNEHSPVLPGEDERFATDTAKRQAMRAWVAHVDDLAVKAQAAHPDLGIETLTQMHQRVMKEIASDTKDGQGISGWRGLVGAFFGDLGAMTAFKSDPWAPVKIGSMFLGGELVAGANVATRMAVMGAMNAGVSLLPGDRQTLAQAGTPQSNEDIAMGALYSFLGGMAFQGLDEAAIGSAGRAIRNDRYSWMTLSKRDAALAKLAPTEPPPMPDVPPVPPTPPAAPPDLAALAARPAGPAVFERMGAGARRPVTSENEYALPGLPPPAQKAALSDISRGQIEPLTSFAQMESAPGAFIPRAQRVPMAILDKLASSRMGKQRLAEDLDMAAQQMEANPTISAQEVVPPTRPLSPNATLHPEVRTWLGPGVNTPPELNPTLQRAALGHTYRLEDAARELDPGLWDTWDQVNKDLKTAKADLDRVTKFQAAAQAGGTDALDKRINELMNQFARSPSSATRMSILQELEDTRAYHADLQRTRAGGVPTAKPPKGLDIVSRVEKLAKIQAKRDELYKGGIERSIARVDNNPLTGEKGLWALQVDDAKAWEESMRPGATDRISQSWRWPDGKRPKDLPKNPYEITLTKGPTQKELMAKRKAEFDQQADPIANDPKAPANETPIETATRVNTTNYENKGKVDAEAFYKQVRDFAKTMEPGGEATPAPRLGQYEAISDKPIRPGIDIEKDIKPAEAGELVGERFKGLTTDGRVRLLDGEVKAVHLGIGGMWSSGEKINPADVTHFKNNFKGADWVSVNKPAATIGGTDIARLWQQGAFEFDGKSLNLKEAMDEIAHDEEAFKSFGSCIAEPAA
jgi:hypothetical protein